MSEVLSERTPAQIASEINLIKRRADKIMLESCLQIGRCLTEAKEVIPYGEWGKWLREEVSYSQRTAQHLMRIYKEFGSELISPAEGLSETNPDSFLSFSQAVLLLKIPAEEREEFMTCHNLETMSKRELQEAVQEVVQGTVQDVQEIAQETIPEDVQEIVPEDVQESTQEPAQKAKESEPLPILTVTRMRRVPRKIVQVTPATSAESQRYNEQFIKHRDVLLSAYYELLVTLSLQSRIDTAAKEVNRKKALEIANNMVKTLEDYPPPLETNLNIKEH